MTGYLLILLVIWLAFAAICAVVAENRGHNRTSWLILGFFFGVFALIGLLLQPPGHHGQKTCPRCAELVKSEASVCRFCGHEFPAGDELTIQRRVDAPVRTDLPNSPKLRCPSCGCGPPNVELVNEGMIFCTPENKVTGVLAT